jgi:hypothetical protein
MKTRIATIAAACAAAVALAAPHAATAREDARSGSFILPWCHAYVAGANSAEAGYCMGVVHGIWDMALTDGEVCSPEHITVEQVIDVVVELMDREPQHLKLPFSSLVLDAMHRVWPCQSSRPRLNS